MLNIAQNSPVLVSEELAAVSNKAVGILTHWRLKGELSRSSLEAAMAGIIPESMFPRNTTDNEALKRALTGLQESKLVRKFSSVKGSEGFSIVVEDRAKLDIDTNEGESAYSVQLSASLHERDGKLQLRVSPKDHPATAKIAEAFRTHKLQLSSLDLSIWLARVIVHELGAVAARETGGIYFIPPSSVEKFRKIEEALRSLSSYNTAGRLVNGIKLYSIPYVTSSEVAELMVDSVMDLVDNTVAEVYETLNNSERKMRARGYAALRNKVDNIITKVGQFSFVISESLPAIQERLDDLMATVGAAEAALVSKHVERRDDAPDVVETVDDNDESDLIPLDLG